MSLLPLTKHDLDIVDMLQYIEGYSFGDRHGKPGFWSHNVARGALRLIRGAYEIPEDVKAAIEHYEALVVEQESRAAESEPTELAAVIERLDNSISWLRDGKTTEGARGIGVADMVLIRAKLTTIEAAPVQGAEQDKPSAHSAGLASGPSSAAQSNTSGADAPPTAESGNA